MNRRRLATALAAASSILLTGCAAGAADDGTEPSAATEGSPSQHQDERASAILVTVRLDVTGTGRGNIRFSTPAGVHIVHNAVLHGWAYSYQARADAPIVLDVTQRAPATSECAAHINGALETSAAGSSPTCTRTSI